MPISSVQLAHFDFVSIRIAVVAARLGNLTDAARECHLALPAASRRLRDLEKALGAPLFERHARGLRPTPLGRSFARRGLEILHALDALRVELTDVSRGVVRHLQVFASTAAITEFLPPLLAEYGRLHPEVQIELEEQVSQRAAAAVREGRADLSLFVSGPDLRGLEVSDFRHDALILILPKAHRLRGRTPLPFAEALDESWISLNAGAALLEAQQRAARSAGRSLRLRMQVRSFDAVGHLVAAGLGVALLPKAAAMPIVQAMGLAWRPLSDAWAQRTLQVAIRPDADEWVRAFRDFLIQPSHSAKAQRRKRE